MVWLKRVCPSPGKHAFHYALEPQRPFYGQLDVFHPIHQPVKHHEDTVVVLSCWHLVEVAVRVESKQPPLLTQHRPPVVQVPLVAHNHYGHFLCVQVVFGGLDRLNEPTDSVEAGPITDAVHKDVAVCPLDLLLKEQRFHRWMLWNHIFKLISNFPDAAS